MFRPALVIVRGSSDNVDVSIVVERDVMKDTIVDTDSCDPMTIVISPGAVSGIVTYSISMAVTIDASRDEVLVSLGTNKFVSGGRLSSVRVVAIVWVLPGRVMFCPSSAILVRSIEPSDVSVAVIVVSSPNEYSVLISVSTTRCSTVMNSVSSMVVKASGTADPEASRSVELSWLKLVTRVE